MQSPTHALAPIASAAMIAASTALLACTSLLGGCSMHAKPTLTVASAQVTDRTDAGFVIDFVINAQNTNEFELPLKEAHYTVWLDGVRVFKGIRSPEASLRRFGTQEVRLPAAVPASIPASIPTNITAATNIQGTVPYRIKGELSYIRPGALSEVLFDAGLITPSRSFSAQGTINLDAPITKR